MKTKLYKWLGIFLAATIVLGIIGGYILDKTGYVVEEEIVNVEEENDVAPTAATPTPVETKVESIESTPSATFESIFADSDSVDINVNEGELKILVTYSDYLTDKGLRDAMYEKIRDVLGLIPTNPEVSSINFQLSVPLKDAAGNVENGMVISYQLYDYTMETVNFDNLEGVDIPEVADIVYLHPSFR